MIFPKRRQVGQNSIEFLRPAESHPESGHDFIENEQRPIAMGNFAQRVEIQGRGRHTSHVADDRLHDHAGDLMAGTF